MDWWKQRPELDNTRGCWSLYIPGAVGEAARTPVQTARAILRKWRNENFHFCRAVQTLHTKSLSLPLQLARCLLFPQLAAGVSLPHLSAHLDPTHNQIIHILKKKKNQTNKKYLCGFNWKMKVMNVTALFPPSFFSECLYVCNSRAMGRKLKSGCLFQWVCNYSPVPFTQKDTEALNWLNLGEC